MRFFTVLALAGAAIAQEATTTWNTNSIYGVLVTALPSSLLAEATDTGKLSSDLAAQFSTATPGWFSSLPDDIKSWIILQGEIGESTTYTPASPTPLPSAVNGTTPSNGSTIAIPTLSGTGSGPAKPTTTLEVSNDGAATVVGGGIAAFVAFLGMLAL